MLGIRKKLSCYSDVQNTLPSPGYDLHPELHIPSVFHHTWVPIYSQRRPRHHSHLASVPPRLQLRPLPATGVSVSCSGDPGPQPELPPSRTPPAPALNGAAVTPPPAPTPTARCVASDGPACTPRGARGNSARFCQKRRATTWQRDLGDSGVLKPQLNSGIDTVVRRSVRHNEN